MTVVIFFSSTKRESMKQCVEPESTKALKIMVFGKSEVVTGKNRALGSKGAEALRQTSSIARSLLSQPEVPKGCCLFFRVLSGFAVGWRDLCGSSFSFRGFGTILCCMSNSTAEETQIIGESTRSLGQGKLSILTKFLPQIHFLPFRVLGCRSVITQIVFFIFVLVVVVVIVVIIIRRAGGLVLWFIVLPVRRLISAFPSSFLFPFPILAIY